MIIGIDISQAVYEGTGVGTYVMRMTEVLLQSAPQHRFVLLGSSWGRRNDLEKLRSRLQTLHRDIRFVFLPLPLALLDLLWNRLHILPIEWLTGYVDVFWSSDWVQPPARTASLVTTIHDLSFVKYPRETDRKIIDVHTRRLRWVSRECQAVFCDSRATFDDAAALLGIDRKKLHVVYPGFAL